MFANHWPAGFIDNIRREKVLTSYWRNIKANVEPLVVSGRHMIVTTCLLIAAVQAMQFAGPYLFKYVIDGLATGVTGRTVRLIWISFGVWMLLGVIKKYRDDHIFTYLLLLQKHLPLQAVAKLVSLPLGYHEQNNTGSTINKIRRGADMFEYLNSTFLFEFLPTAIQTVATFIILLVLNWRIALLFSAVIPPYAVVTYWLNRRVQPLRRSRFDGYELSASTLTQTIMNVATVQSYAQEDAEVQRLTDIQHGIFCTELKEWRTVIRVNLLRDLIINLGRLAVLLVSTTFIMRHEISLGSLVLFLSLSEQAYFSLFRLSRIFDISAEGAEAITRLAKLVKEHPAIVSSLNAGDVTRIKGAINFDHVTFAYTANGDEALNDISFTVQPGETVALVGTSGSGKTTIVKLLYRHYDVTDGRVAIDGRDVRQLPLSEVREQMAIVPQEVDLFDRSIRDNIAFAQPQATDEQVIMAAKQAHAHEFIVRLPDGYNTLVGERGYRLSGGQRQRVGIARAILTDPRILVFDEATSQLDSQSERLIQTALEDLRRGRTTILIAHRLSTIQRADRILVFDRGRLIEQGDHARLVSCNGLYASLHRLQVEGVVT
jgi:ABC-type multidrug transport system fused ATPase/permease subunit